MTLNELSILVTGKETTKNDGMITFLSYDSRECIEGSAFFCFKGTKTDGKLFIKQAIANGAIAVITDLPVELPDNVECLVTKENIRSIYAKASGLFFNYPAKNLAIIGVSGTDGKSSTSYFIYQLIKLLGHNCGLSSTVYVDDGTGLRNTPWRNSTPEAFPLHGFLKKACDNSCEYMVIEATSHALSKEYDRLDGITFASSCLTRITSEHLEFHKTHQAYVEAKLRLLEKTERNAFVFSDNNERKMIEERFSSLVEFIERPRILERDIYGMTFIYENREYHLPFFHSYMLENAFEAACLVSSLLSLDIFKVLEKLEYLKGVQGRDERVANSIGRNIIIDFAHTPDSVSRLLSDYRTIFPDGDFITVLGAAGDRDKSKRAGLGKEASRYSSHLILTEEDNRSESFEDIANDILAGIPIELRNRIDIIKVPTREEAIKKAITISSPKDTIFLLGKGHERSIESKGTREYSESSAVRNVLDNLCAPCSR